MDNKRLYSPLLTEDMQQLMDLAQVATQCSDLNDFASHLLTSVTSLTQSASVLLYIADSSSNDCHIFQSGLSVESVSVLEQRCAQEFAKISSQSGQSASAASLNEPANNMKLYPLQYGETYVGLVGLETQIHPTQMGIWEWLLRLISGTIGRINKNDEAQKQLVHLNTYVSISSMLAQSLSLHELLQTALYCCMETVSSEAASVLLLDEDKSNFVFYQVEGPSAPLLQAAKFPADKGIAGTVLKAQQSELVNSFHDDSRSYQNIDKESGFRTRNMIAVPLTAGDERVGVLEVLNKANGSYFSKDDLQLLLLVAEEIALAIRNAKMFEYVANSYCKQRQGESSCKGCKRPLGSWTPCVKYREISV